jgi:hypothetical protein
LVDDLTEIAARYHRDKLGYTLGYPRVSVSGQNGVSRESFDYFPEYHYRKGFERLHEDFDDSVLNEWMEEILEGTLVSATHGGLWRDEIPELVTDILSSSQSYEAEITIKPEGTGDSYDYLVEWQYIDYDHNQNKWKPITENNP